MKQILVLLAKSIRRTTLCAGLFGSLTAVQGADVVKADNADNLDLTTSWIGGVLPGPGDIAVWDSTVTAANTTVFGSVSQSWAGIRIANPADAVTVVPAVSGSAVTISGGSQSFAYSVAPAIPLASGQRAILGGTTAPQGFALGTLYHVVNATATTFELSASSGGVGIFATNSGTAVTVTGGPTMALGTSGIDMSAATTNFALNSLVSLGGPQAWSVTADRTLSTAGIILGTGGLTKSGAGTLALGGVNSYSGGVVNNLGVLQANVGTAFGVASGGLTNMDGTTLRINTATSIPNPPNWNGTVTVDLNNFANNQALTGSWSGTGTVNVVNQNSAVLRTFTMGGSSANWNGFTGRVNVGTNIGFFRFNDGGGNGNTGNSQATMDLGTTTASFLTRNRNAPVSFGVLLGGPGTRVINGSSSSGTSTYSIGGKNVPFTFEGSFVDASTTAALAVTKVGSSTTILLGTNKYFGATTVSAGTLQVGNGGTIGNLGSGPIVNNASLVYDRSDAVTISNAISGSGNLTLQGGIVATFEGTNTSSGSLVVSAGAADVGAGGWIQCPISLASGSTLIVTNNPLFTLNQALSGSGTVDGGLTAVGGTIRPGGTGTGGTLTFLNNFTNSGAVTYEMELATASPTDLVNITGDLTVTATNAIVASKLGGGTLALGTYPLINYSGAFNGTLANFSVTVVGVTGTLTNPPGQIALIITPAPRGATNLTWVGDGAANAWDVNTSTNWVNGLAQFTFLTGDSVTFDATGAANPTVNVTASVVQPAGVFVNAANSYTITGNGAIAGGGGITKSNTGTLTIQTTNTYAGRTVVGGGTLDINSVANGNSPSAIGASISNPTNLVIAAATLRYSGPDASSDRGIMLAGGGNLDVVAANLTLNGAPVTGGGGLAKSGSGTLTLAVPNSYTGGTVLSNGVLALGANIANNDGAGGGGLGATNNAVTFRGGTLQLFGYDGGTGNNYATCYNPLIVPAGETGTLRLFPRGPANSGGNAGLQSSLTGAGTLNLVANYVRDDLSGDWSAFTGVINVTPRNAADEMRINNNFGYANATINLNDGITLCRSFSPDTVNDIGALNGTSLAAIGPGNSSGVRTTWRVGWLNTDATFAGTLGDDGGNTVIKVGTGTWTLGGAVSAANLIVSNGVVAVTSSLTSTNIRVASSASLDVSTLGTLALAAGQTLGGNGTVLGSVDCSGGGNVAPGFSIGTLTVTNTATLGGTTIMEVNRSGFLSDKLSALAIIYGGTLAIRNTGAALQVGDTFDLFDGVPSGSFSTVAGGYHIWDTSNLAVNGAVTVIGILAPPTLSASSTPTDLVLSSTGGLPGGVLSIVTATDVAMPLSSWAVVVSDVFDGTGNYTTSIPIDVNTSKRFYAIRAE